MKIGILIHSYTGNTYSVAEKLRNKLFAAGHIVDLMKIEPAGGENLNQADINKITFEHFPDLSQYDTLVFGAPVRAFSISPVLSAYLSKIDSLKHKKVHLFVTQQLAHPWMGGKHAISQMRKSCEQKGAVIGSTGIVNWKNKKRDQMITDVVDLLSRL